MRGGSEPRVNCTYVELDFNVKRATDHQPASQCYLEMEGDPRKGRLGRERHTHVDGEKADGVPRCLRGMLETRHKDDEKKATNSIVDQFCASWLVAPHCVHRSIERSACFACWIGASTQFRPDRIPGSIKDPDRARGVSPPNPID